MCVSHLCLNFLPFDKEFTDRMRFLVLCASLVVAYVSAQGAYNYSYSACNACIKSGGTFGNDYCAVDGTCSSSSGCTGVCADGAPQPGNNSCIEGNVFRCPKPLPSFAGSCAACTANNVGAYCPLDDSCWSQDSLAGMTCTGSPCAGMQSCVMLSFGCPGKK